MTDVMISGDIGDNRMYHRAREAGAAASAGAQKLLQLHALLDKGWFRDRHNVRFEIEPAGNGGALLILRAGSQLIAKWTARSDTLVFTTSSGTEVRAEIMDCAISITCEFLDQTRTRRN
jgi:hypothetical protein